MSQIQPFKAIYYNAEKAGDISGVVCPPYDVISPEEQAWYHNLHPYNFIRLDLGQEKGGDNKYDNKYVRARKTFEEWLDQGILQEDSKPCIYFYRQEYFVRGQKHSRFGFIALMKLQDREKEDSKIFPHENIQSKAKEDRVRLLRQVKANLSSIFVCFSDRAKTVEKIFHQNITLTKPFIQAVDNERVTHKLWRLEDSDLLRKIEEALANEHLFIADGHHRYQAALEYRRLMSAKGPKSSGQEPYNYIMTYFTNMDSKDLLILPIHRVIRKLPAQLDFLEEFFRIDKIKNVENLQILLAKAGQNEHAFGLCTKEGIRLLRLKSRLLVEAHIKEGSKEFRSLDATILKHFILDRVGIHHEDILYTKDIDHAMGLVAERKADAGFIMNPVAVHQLKAIALNGERMPPKTTYFYPKVLSGLTIYRTNP